MFQKGRENGGKRNEVKRITAALLAGSDVRGTSGGCGSKEGTETKKVQAIRLRFVIDKRIAGTTAQVDITMILLDNLKKTSRWRSLMIHRGWICIQQYFYRRMCIWNNGKYFSVSGCCQSSEYIDNRLILDVRPYVGAKIRNGAADLQRGALSYYQVPGKEEGTYAIPMESDWSEFITAFELVWKSRREEFLKHGQKFLDGIKKLKPAVWSRSCGNTRQLIATGHLHDQIFYKWLEQMLRRS